MIKFHFRTVISYLALLQGKRHPFDDQITGSVENYLLIILISIWTRLVFDMICDKFSLSTTYVNNVSTMVQPFRHVQLIFDLLPSTYIDVQPARIDGSVSYPGILRGMLTVP